MRLSPVACRVEHSTEVDFARQAEEPQPRSARRQAPSGLLSWVQKYSLKNNSKIGWHASVSGLLERCGLECFDLHLGDTVAFHFFHGVPATFKIERIADAWNSLQA